MTVQHLSIVVLGSMNPAIHHPTWYKLTGIITDVEHDQATQHPIFCTPHFSSFQASNFAVQCLAQRWEVATQLGESEERILQVAVATFKKLYETPLAAYGFNHNYEVETSSDNVAHRLVDLASRTGLGFPIAEGAQATLEFVEPSGGCLFKTRVSPSSRGPSYVSFAHNAQYQVRTDRLEHFDLGPLLEKGASAGSEHASAQLKKVVNGFKGAREP